MQRYGKRSEFMTNASKAKTVRGATYISATPGEGSAPEIPN
jgi:hypothetical protein